MKNPEIGRNDPCPCGSGKKYKKCCLGREAAKPPTGSAAGVMDEIRKALAGEEFSSLAEAQAFTARFMQQRNQAPIDDFHGLSSDQMHRFLNAPFDNPDLVTFPETVGPKPEAPILTLFGLLAAAVGDRGLKTTATGNLPRNFCREAALAYWGEETYQENTRFGGINKEDDFLDLHVTRLVAGLAGLIRKYRGRFILGRECRKLLAGPGVAAIYPRLFKTYVHQFNWSYRDRHDEILFIQRSFLFTLYLLTRYGDAWRPHTFYEDNFLRAFPMVLGQIAPDPVFTPERGVRMCYTWRTLVHFAGFLGLAAVEPMSKEGYDQQYRVKKRPLLQEAVRFHQRKYSTGSQRRAKTAGGKG